MPQIILGYNNFLMRRKKLLQSCDWMFSPNNTVGVDNDVAELWKIYRQELRDIPQKNREKPKHKNLRKNQIYKTYFLKKVVTKK